MKDTKKEQLLWLVISTLFIAGMIFFIQDSGATAALAATFTAIVGIFIGLDIAVMIKRTSTMSNGDFKSINKSRYIAAFIIFSGLLMESFIISAVQDRNCDSLYTSFGMGFLIVIGGLISGIEGNKIVTNPEEPPGKSETCKCKSFTGETAES